MKSLGRLIRTVGMVGKDIAASKIDCCARSVAANLRSLSANSRTTTRNSSAVISSIDFPNHVMVSGIVAPFSEAVAHEFSTTSRFAAP